MLRNLVQFYSMAICFVASIIAMITIAVMIMSMTDLVFVEYKQHSELANFSTNEKYLLYNKTLDADLKNNPEKLASFRMTERENYIEDKKLYAIRGLINEACWFISAALFFMLHWKLYYRSVGFISDDKS